MYAVIGASGYLGTYVIKNILQNTKESILAVSRGIPAKDTERVNWFTCDVTKPEDVMRLNETANKGGNPLKLIYLAAYHHPDQVEKNFRLSWDTNITSLSRFLNSLDGVQCLYYISTDSVYGESIDGYRFRESDLPHPVNRYGVQKSVAENLVVGYGHHVVRYPFLIGPSLVPNRKHFYDEIAETIKNGKLMDMFADSYHSTLDFDTAAKLLIQIIENMAGKAPPVVNICGDESLSKYEVGLRIARKIGADEKFIHPISIHEDGYIFETRRAASTLMDNSLLKKLLGIRSIELSL